MTSRRRYARFSPRLAKGTWITKANYINEIHEQDLKELEAKGCTIVTLSREEQEKWAASLPDIVNGLVKSLDSAGYNGAEIVEKYYQILESHGGERIRDWNIGN